MAHLHIRTADASDLPILLSLYADMHDHDEQAGEEELSHAWKEIMDNPAMMPFILEVDFVPVSTCMFIHVPNLSRGARPFGIIENVVTGKQFRNKGYGTALICHVLDHAWKKNCYKVMLLSGRKSEAVFRFYEQAGFLRGEKEGFIAYPP